MRKMRMNRWLPFVLLVIGFCAVPVLACMPQGSDMVPIGETDAVAELPGGG